MYLHILPTIGSGRGPGISSKGRTGSSASSCVVWYRGSVSSAEHRTLSVAGGVLKEKYEYKIKLGSYCISDSEWNVMDVVNFTGIVLSDGFQCKTHSFDVGPWRA